MPHLLHLQASLQENAPSLLQELRKSVPDMQLLSDDTEWCPDKEEAHLHDIRESVRLPLPRNGWM